MPDNLWQILVKSSINPEYRQGIIDERQAEKRMNWLNRVLPQPGHDLRPGQHGAPAPGSTLGAELDPVYERERMMKELFASQFPEDRNIGRNLLQNLLTPRQTEPKNFQTITTGVEGDPKGRQQHVITRDANGNPVLTPIGPDYQVSGQNINIGGTGGLWDDEKKRKYGFPTDAIVADTPQGPKIVDRFSEGHKKAAGYAMEAEQALTTMDALEAGGYIQPTMWESLINADETFFNDTFKSLLQTDKGALLHQSMKQFINAVLRKKSGAAITLEDYKSVIPVYLPQPWDSEELLKRKKQAREMELGVMRSQSGGLSDKYDEQMRDREKRARAILEGNMPEQTTSLPQPPAGFVLD